MKSYRSRMGVQLSIGNVYRELQRLTAEHFIATAENPPDADPRRAPYRVTEDGRRALAAWLATPLESPGRSATDDLACRLALVADMKAAEAVPLLESLRNQLWDFAKSVERERANVAGTSRDPGKLFVPRETLLARQAMQVAADISVVEELLGTMTAQPAVPARPSAAMPETGRRARSRPRR